MVVLAPPAFISILAEVNSRLFGFSACTVGCNPPVFAHHSSVLKLPTFFSPPPFSDFRETLPLSFLGALLRLLPPLTADTHYN